MSHTVCVVAPARVRENARICKEWGRQPEQDLSQLPPHFHPVYPGLLRSPSTEVGRFGDQGEGRNVWEAERKTGRWETNFTKLESGKSWRFQVQSEPGYFLPKRRPLAEMKYTEPYITTGFATDGGKKVKKNPSPPNLLAAYSSTDAHDCHCSAEWQPGSCFACAHTHTHTISNIVGESLCF